MSGMPALGQLAARELDVALVERRIDLEEQDGLLDVQHLRHDPENGSYWMSFFSIRHAARRHMRRPKATMNARCDDVRPALEAERRVADELDEVVERVELGQRLRPLGQLVDREERAGDEEQRRQPGADHVVEVLDRLGHARRRGCPSTPSRSPPRSRRTARASIPHAGSSPKTIATSSGAQPYVPGADGDPQRLGGDELLHVHGRGEDRVVGALELVLDERREHAREGRGEQHRGGHRARADEVDVVVAGHLETSEPKPNPKASR